MHSERQVAVEDFAGVPDDITTSETIPEDTDGAPQAFYLNDGGELAVVLWGSSTCPYIGTDISVVKPADEGNEVKVTVAASPRPAVHHGPRAPHHGVLDPDEDHDDETAHRARARRQHHGAGEVVRSSSRSYRAASVGRPLQLVRERDAAPRARAAAR